MQGQAEQSCISKNRFQQTCRTVLSHRDISRLLHEECISVIQSNSMTKRTYNRDLRTATRNDQNIDVTKIFFGQLQGRWLHITSHYSMEVAAKTTIMYRGPVYGAIQVC